MPIQPGLALQVKGLELPDPLAMQAQATQIQNALQQQRMGEMQIQNALREQQRAQELRGIMSGFAPDAPAADVAGRLQKGGFFQEAGQTLQQAALREETLRKARAARLTEIKTQAELAGRIFSGVSDQGSYTAARTRAIQQGLATADEIPEAYDKAAVDRIVRNAIDVPKALELEYKGRQTAAQEATASAAGVRGEAAMISARAAQERAGQERVPASIREFRAAQAMPEEERTAFYAAKQAGRPSTTVNVDQRGEQAETVARGKGYVEHETEVRKAAAAARRSLVGIESAQDVLSRDFETGFGTETIAKGASVLAALGVDKAKDFATNSQKFLQAATERVLAAQLEQKGVQTDQDAKRIEQMGARLGNTKAANEFILDVARTQAELAIAHDKFYRDWLSDPKNNNSLRGAENAWLESEGNKSIFESPRLKKYGVLQAERAQSTSAPSGPVVGGRSATPRGSATMSEVPAFRTVQEAEAANLPKGTRITVGGRPAEVN
jgi:hypothetical protein